MPLSFRLLFGLVATLAPAWADVTASISGKVEDATGTPVSGATLTARSLDTGVTRSATTDDGGNFRILALPLGRQEVKAEKTGFKAAVRQGINLEVGQEGIVNLRLEVGDFVQQVVVTEAVPLVNTTAATVSGVVGEREVKDLPLNGRSFDNLIGLNPGAINFSAMKSAKHQHQRREHIHGGGAAARRQPVLAERH